jgi:hypothetical protein
MDRFSGVPEQPETGDLASLEEELAAAEEEQRQLEEHLRRRERKLWAARSRMPQHGRHFLRDQRRQYRRRSEHMVEE